MKPGAAFLFSAHLLAVISICSVVACSTDEEKVTFYSTYGHEEGGHWVIPMRLWVHGRHRLVDGAADEAVSRITKDMGTVPPEEVKLFRSRIQHFVADSESREDIVFKFAKDPRDQEYRVQDHRGNFSGTNTNGLIEGTIRIPKGQAEELLKQQGSRDGWLAFRATSRNHDGTGRVRLIAPVGLSVISDIDDTIKVTEIPAGPRVVIRNTFFREFTDAPGMAATYQQWGQSGAAFHYVSGGPWQLYEPLSEFLFSEEVGFPEGSFHMKNVRKNLLSLSSWKDLNELVANENHTFELKVDHISTIIQRFPARKFILVGDSGEKDPEVYREIKRRFSDKVQEIRIRDVVNDKEKNPSRLEGMTIIQAGVGS